MADIAKLSVGREEYYTRELATDHEQYLSGHGAMFEGRDPRTGELLGRPHGRNAIPDFDVVLRPTKSVSILYGLGDAAIGRAVLHAHHAGLAADAIYRSTYQRELSQSLGVEWTAADAYGNREVAGIPEALVRSFSKRTGQIDLELDRLVADGWEQTPRLVKWAVQATRKPK